MTQNEFIEIISKIYPEYTIASEDKGNLKIVYFLNKIGKIENSFIVNNFEQIISNEIAHFENIKSIAEKALNVLNKRFEIKYLVNNDLQFKIQR